MCGRMRSRNPLIQALSPIQQAVRSRGAFGNIDPGELFSAVGWGITPTRFYKIQGNTQWSAATHPRAQQCPAGTARSATLYDSLEAEFRQERCPVFADRVIVLGSRASAAVHHSGSHFQLVGRMAIVHPLVAIQPPDPASWRITDSFLSARFHSAAATALAMLHAAGAV